MRRREVQVLDQRRDGRDFERGRARAEAGRSVLAEQLEQAETIGSLLL